MQKFEECFEDEFTEAFGFKSDDHKFCRDGVFELRVDVGPGYRVYYALSGDQIVLLFSGGTKGTQAADIDRACAYWKIFQEQR